MESIKRPSKNGRKTLEVHIEAAMPCKMVTRKRAWKLREAGASENANPHKKRLWKLTNSQRNVWNLLFQEIMKITSPHAADAVSAYVLHDTKVQHLGQAWKSQWSLSNEICTGTRLQASCGKDSLSSMGTWMKKKGTELGMFFLFDYSCWYTWMT